MLDGPSMTTLRTSCGGSSRLWAGQRPSGQGRSRVAKYTSRKGRRGASAIVGGLPRAEMNSRARPSGEMRGARSAPGLKVSCINDGRPVTETGASKSTKNSSLFPASTPWSDTNTKCRESDRNAGSRATEPKGGRARRGIARRPAIQIVLTSSSPRDASVGAGRAAPVLGKDGVLAAARELGEGPAVVAGGGGMTSGADARTAAGASHAVRARLGATATAPSDPGEASHASRRPDGVNEKISEPAPGSPGAENRMSPFGPSTGSRPDAPPGRGTTRPPRRVATAHGTSSSSPGRAVDPERDDAAKPSTVAKHARRGCHTKSTRPSEWTQGWWAQPLAAGVNRSRAPAPRVTRESIPHPKSSRSSTTMASPSGYQAAAATLPRALRRRSSVNRRSLGSAATRTPARNDRGIHSGSAVVVAEGKTPMGPDGVDGGRSHAPVRHRRTATAVVVAVAVSAPALRAGLPPPEPLPDDVIAGTVFASCGARHRARCQPVAAPMREPWSTRLERFRQGPGPSLLVRWPLVCKAMS